MQKFSISSFSTGFVHVQSSIKTTTTEKDIRKYYNNCTTWIWANMISEPQHSVSNNGQPVVPRSKDDNKLICEHWKGNKCHHKISGIKCAFFNLKALVEVWVHITHMFFKNGNFPYSRFYGTWLSSFFQLHQTLRIWRMCCCSRTSMAAHNPPPLPCSSCTDCQGWQQKSWGPKHWQLVGEGLPRVASHKYIVQEPPLSPALQIAFKGSLQGQPPKS